MDKGTLWEILDRHGKWLRDEDGGKRANLRDADLRGANLRDANLGDANLRDANLRYADLRDADLRYADLRGADLGDADLRDANLRYANLKGADLGDANLSGCKNLLNTIEWLSENCEATDDGVIAYKTFSEHYDPPNDWKIGPGAVITEVVNPLPTVACASGVNVGTAEWIWRNTSGEVWRVLIRWPWLISGVVPYSTGGKWRVARAELVEIVSREELREIADGRSETEAEAIEQATDWCLS